MKRVAEQNENTHTHTIWGGSDVGAHLRTEPIRTLRPRRTETVKTPQIPAVRVASCTPLHKMEEKQSGEAEWTLPSKAPEFLFLAPPPTRHRHTHKRKTSQMLKIEIKWLDWGLQKSVHAGKSSDILPKAERDLRECGCLNSVTACYTTLHFDKMSTHFFFPCVHMTKKFPINKIFIKIQYDWSQWKRVQTGYRNKLHV